MTEQRKSGDRKHSWQDSSEAERQGKFAQAGKQRSSPHIIPSIADSPALPALRSSSKTALTSATLSSLACTKPIAPPSPRSPKSPQLQGTFEEFVPRRVLQWYIRNVTTAVREPKIVPIRAVVAFLDVSGFTPMTEKLSQRGPEGAEMVCTILSEYFTTLLEVVFSWGGDVIKFAGDALLVCFRLPDTPNTAEDLQVALGAIQCALEAASIDFERQGVPLHLKVALGVGAPYMVHVGSEDRWEIFIAGPPLLQLGSAEHEAAIGATVVSPQLWELVSAHALGTKTAGGNFVLKSLNAKPVQPPRSEHAKVPDGVQDSISLYVPGMNFSSSSFLFFCSSRMGT